MIAEILALCLRELANCGGVWAGERHTDTQGTQNQNKNMFGIKCLQTTVNIPSDRLPWIWQLNGVARRANMA